MNKAKKMYKWDNLPGFDRTKEKFLALELEKWLVDNGIKEEGERLGHLNQPGSEATSLDATEHQIVDWINFRGNDCRQDVSNHLSDLEQNLLSHVDEEQLNVLENEVPVLENQGLHSIETSVTKGRQKLLPQYKETARAYDDFDTFRRKAGLTRLADYSHRRTALFMIWGFFFVEVVLNATLLMEVNIFGLVGSTLQMGLISLVNVIIAGLAVGGLLRLSKHIFWGWKIMSWVMILAIVGLVGVFNLAIGHLRDSMAAIVGDPFGGYPFN